MRHGSDGSSEYSIILLQGKLFTDGKNLGQIRVAARRHQLDQVWDRQKCGGAKCLDVVYDTVGKCDEGHGLRWSASTSSSKSSGELRIEKKWSLFCWIASALRRGSDGMALESRTVNNEVEKAAREERQSAGKCRYVRQGQKVEKRRRA